MSEEGEVQKKILEYLKKIQIWHRRLNSGAARMNGRRVHFGSPGLPDIMARTKSGTIIWIECKSSTGKLSEDQRKWKDDMEKFGDTFITARHLDDVRALFEGNDDSL